MSVLLLDVVVFVRWIETKMSSSTIASVFWPVVVIVVAVTVTAWCNSILCVVVVGMVVSLLLVK